MEEIRSDDTPQVLRSDRGASLVEYAMLVVMIAVVCVASVRVLGGTTDASVADSGDKIKAAATSGP